ncbi:MAG: hypothetical protein Q7T01_00400 [bacterium]|nr:hypothetical protein [bacterium]
MIQKILMVGIAALVLGACNGEQEQVPSPEAVSVSTAQQEDALPVKIKNPPLTNVTPAEPLTLAPLIDTAGIAPCAYSSGTLAYSEYASWSTYDVAEMQGYVSGQEGRCGPVERKYGVDVVLKFMEYDPSIGAFAARQVDAVTITNGDTLGVATASDQPVVAVHATSTSYGADRILVPKSVTGFAGLKALKCRGLEATVSHYNVEEVSRANGVDPTGYTYAMMDPGAAAAAMKTNDPEAQCISVWEPFAQDTLAARSDVHVLADSTAIPAEILDLVVVHQAVLDRPHGKAFVLALIEAYYRVVADLEGPDSDNAHRRLGKKVTDLSAEQMRDVLTRSVLYRRPQWVVSLFTDGQTFPFPEGVTSPPLSKIMEKNVAWAKAHGVTKGADVTVGYGAKDAATNASFRFDPTYVQAFMAQQ